HVHRREFASPAERAEQRFFLSPNNNVYGGVRLNIQGREPRGRVRSDHVDVVIAALERDLMALINTKTGKPVINGIERCERWYRRSPGDTRRDLFLDWERSVPVESVWSAKTGTVEAPYENWRSGDHRPWGLLLAAGPDMPAGKRLPPIAVEDLPASLMARFGEAASDMDGRPVSWLASAPGPAEWGSFTHQRTTSRSFAARIGRLASFGRRCFCSESAATLPSFQYILMRNYNVLCVTSQRRCPWHLSA